MNLLHLNACDTVCDVDYSDIDNNGHGTGNLCNNGGNVFDFGDRAKDGNNYVIFLRFINSSYAVMLRQIL